MSSIAPTGGDPGDGIPRTLKLVSGLTWRVLIVLAGVVVAGYILDVIFPVHPSVRDRSC
ncbi:MAG: hypothetical protein NTX29_14325 [Actinobacteria bacterium]|nr:hypothetical protein [Actinomycetota bacterium]